MFEKDKHYVFRNGPAKKMKEASPQSKKLFSFFGILILSSLLINGCCDPCENGTGPCCPEGDEIFYTAKPLNSEVPGIFAVSPDGSSFRTVVKNGILFSRPSENGKLVFLRNDPQGNDSIVMVDLDGSNLEGIVNERISRTTLTFPVLSPDAKWVAFTGRDKDGLNVLSLHWIADDRTVEISYSLAESILPVFSPDSKYMAFFEEQNEELVLRVIDPNRQQNFDAYPPKNTGYKLRDLIEPPSIDWSSDGMELVYSFTSADSSQIIIARVDQSDEKVLRLDQIGAIATVFRPGSKRLAFISTKGDLWTADSDTANPDLKRLIETDSTQFNSNPEWSPDGSMIIFNNYSVFDEQEGASLILFDLENEIPVILSSKNVNPKGFWKR